jgi:hypothetical protein
MADRFFVTVIARDREHLRRLLEYNVDLFAGGADEQGRPTIDGLIKLQDVARLVEDGYQVLVSETDAPRENLARVGLDEWLKDNLADLDSYARRSE